MIKEKEKQEKIVILVNQENEKIRPTMV